MSFDFKHAVVDNEARPMEVRMPGDTKVVARIWLRSLEATEPRELARRQEVRRIKNMSRTKALDPEAVEADNLDLLAACVVKWEDVAWQGEVLECTRRNARNLFENVVWLRNEAMRFVSEVSNFLDTPQTNSVSTSEIGSVLASE